MTAQDEFHESISDQTRELTITELDAAAGGWAPLAGMLAAQQPKTSINPTFTCRKAGHDQQ